MHPSQFAKGMHEKRSNLYKDDAGETRKLNVGGIGGYILFRSTREARSEYAKQHAMQKYASEKLNLGEPFCKITQGFVRLFLGEGLVVTSCLNAFNRLSLSKIQKGAEWWMSKYGRRPQALRALHDGQRSWAEYMVTGGDRITG